MKIIVTLLAGLCLSIASFAQTDSTVTTPTAGSKGSSFIWYNKNTVKINLSSIALNNYSLYYERMLTRKISATVGFRYMPKTKLTETILGKEVLNQLDEEDNEDIKPLAASNNTVTAGIRFYTGSRSGAKGFYAEVYGRYGDFRLDYDYSFTTNGKEYDMVIKGKAKGFGGGLLLGGQFNLFKNMVVDLYIVGAHYGKITGDIDGISDLSTMTAQEKRDMESDINDIAPEIGSKKILSATVDNSGVKGKLDGPFAGIRGLGLSIGWAF